jgi:hypothetical protein
MTPFDRIKQTWNDGRFKKVSCECILGLDGGHLIKTGDHPTESIEREHRPRQYKTVQQSSNLISKREKRDMLTQTFI